MTHLPKNPYCDACQRAKMENVKPYHQDSARDKGFEKRGEHVTNDTMVLHGLGNKGNHGETDAVVFYDLVTGWLDAVPVKGRVQPVKGSTLDVFQRCTPIMNSLLTPMLRCTTRLSMNAIFRPVV